MLNNQKLRPTRIRETNMKFTNLICVLSFLIAFPAFADVCETPDGAYVQQHRLLHSGRYTLSDVSLIYVGGQLSNTGNVTSCTTDVKIYDDCLYYGNGSGYKFLRTEKIGSAVFRYYGNESGSTKWLYVVPSDYSQIRHEYHSNGVMVLTMSFPGNGNSGAGGAGGVNQGSAGYGNGQTSTPQRRARKCGVCGGTGETIQWTTRRSDAEQYCAKCRKVMPVNHYHAKCRNCNGTGIVQ